MRLFAGAGLLAILLSTTAIADTSSMNTSVTGMGILENDYVKAGVNGTAGSFGSGGNTSPGLLFDSTGTGTFNTSYDYLTPGSPFDGFAVMIDGTNYANNNGSSNSITGDGNGLTDGENSLSWTGGVTGEFDITNTYTLGTDAPYIDITSAITMGKDATDVYFGRYIDPDARAADGDSSSTDNVLGYGAIPDSNVAFSEALSSRYALGLYSTDSNVDAGITGWTTDANSYTENAVDGDGSNTNTGDNTIGLSWHFEDVEAGDILEANYAYIFGPSAFDAAEDAVTGGAGGGADILTGDLEDVGSATDAADGSSGPTVVGSASSSVTSHSSSTSEGVQTITRTKTTSTWDVYSDSSTGTPVDTTETLDPFVARMDQVDQMLGLDAHHGLGIADGVAGGAIEHEMGNGYNAQSTVLGIGHSIVLDNGVLASAGYNRIDTELTGADSSGTMATNVLSISGSKHMDRGFTLGGNVNLSSSELAYSRTIGDFGAAGETVSADNWAQVTVEKSAGAVRPWIGYTVGERTVDGYAETGDVQALLLHADTEESYNRATIGVNIETGVITAGLAQDLDDAGANHINLGLHRDINDRISIGGRVARTQAGDNVSTYATAGIRITF